ncbi:hypothetical protein COCSADRAFT_182405 [Bipolaris sorokiniana ND90Pr]|uniref:SnoaL-like domain-containing protein n=1 Tax=Cochliobolus sativus (strain ND90Pr / ATCC 201652) TaxID=665912 RepID=M2SLI8_COCSN|nr:uncharacterized protein COCSADRAFT_182405 [Bipolaris sorokiniana ND90Pr]EMD63130.1 hypothetical protein COCSADRAFT_182405 [Bipolaris sorokiniana ND90Pr]
MTDLLHFSQSEIRFATAALAAIATLAPLAYHLYPSQSQENAPHMQTFNAFIRSYSTLSPHALTTHATRDFTHSSLPSDWGLPPLPIRTFRDNMEAMFDVFSSFEVTPQDDGYGGPAVHFSRDTDTVVAHCRMGGKINNEGDRGRALEESGITEWWTEAVLFVKMSKDGRRVEGVREFMHSKKAEELQMRLETVLGE